MHWHVLQGFTEYSLTATYQYDSLYLTTIKTCLISNPLCPSRPAHRRRKGCYTAGRGFVHHGCSSSTLRNGSCFSWVSISSRRVSSALACTLVPWARYKNALPIQGKVGDPSVALGSLMKALYTLFFNKNKLNKNIEAEIARKIRTIQEQSEAEIFFQQTNISPRRQCKANDSFQNSGSLLYSLSDIYITLKLHYHTFRV